MINIVRLIKHTDGLFGYHRAVAGGTAFDTHVLDALRTCPVGQGMRPGWRASSRQICGQRIWCAARTCCVFTNGEVRSAGFGGLTSPKCTIKFNSCVGVHPCVSSACGGITNIGKQYMYTDMNGMHVHLCVAIRGWKLLVKHTRVLRVPSYIPSVFSVGSETKADVSPAAGRLTGKFVCGHFRAWVACMGFCWESTWTEPPPLLKNN